MKKVKTFHILLLLAGSFQALSQTPSWNESIFVSTSGSTPAYGHFGATGTGPAGIIFDASNGDWIGGDYGSIIQADDLSVQLSNSGPNPIYLRTGHQTRMAIFNSGNVGIGTTNPGSYRLSIHASDNHYSLIQLSNNANAINGIQFGNVSKVSNDSEIWNWENGYFRIATNNSERFRILADGNVGIGTTAPSELLELTGNGPSLRIRSTDPSENASLKLSWGTDDLAGMHLSYHPNTAVGFIDNQYLNAPGSVYGDIQFRRRLSGGMIPYMTMKAETGNVGIGTTTPSNKLEVNGTIRSKEVKVEASPWPDYVFEEDYNLRSLEETAAYIKANKHLPEIPSAKEMEANGVHLGEMNMLLLKKIEELTLYVIELKKENEAQQQEIEKLKSK